jgi:uncharacterized membrane protein
MVRMVMVGMVMVMIVVAVVMVVVMVCCWWSAPALRQCSDNDSGSGRAVTRR